MLNLIDISKETEAAERSLQVLETDSLTSDIKTLQFALRYPEHWFAPLEQAPQANEIEEKTVEWMSKLGLIRTPNQLATVRAMCPRFYGGCPSSMLSFEGALLNTQYLTMWLLWDDEIAEANTEVSQLESDFAAMAGLQISSGGADTPYGEAWRQVGDALQRMGGTSALRKRWADAMREYATHALTEEKIRRSQLDDRRSQAEALRLRTYTIGIAPAIIYLEACSGIELPDQVTTTAEYQAFSFQSAILQSIQNDLASMGKDFRQGYLSTNLALRYLQQTGSSLREACLAIIGIHDATVAEFGRLTHKLLDNAENHLREQLAAYFTIIRYVETGFGFYHVRANRYTRHVMVEDRYAFRITLARSSAPVEQIKVSYS